MKMLEKCITIHKICLIPPEILLLDGFFMSLTPGRGFVWLEMRGLKARGLLLTWRWSRSLCLVVGHCCSGQRSCCGNSCFQSHDCWKKSENIFIFFDFWYPKICYKYQKLKLYLRKSLGTMTYVVKKHWTHEFFLVVNVFQSVCI